MGRLMAGLIEAGESGRDHDRDPVRFALNDTQQTCIVGVYRRLRAINSASGF